MMQPRPSQATSVTFRGLCTGDLFVVVDISKKRTGTGYDELRICFYIFFGLASVVSSLSLISKRAVWPPLCGCVHSSLPPFCVYALLTLGQHSAGSRMRSGTIAAAPTLCLKRIRRAVSPPRMPDVYSIAQLLRAHGSTERGFRALCMVRLINENQQATMEYYIQVKKIYFYAAVALLEGTNRLGGSLLDLASIGTASRAASATGVQTLSVSVSDAPFVFLNAVYIEHSTDCGANKTSDPTSINALVLISFATSAALLGSDFAVALCDLMLEAVPLYAGTRPRS